MMKTRISLETLLEQARGHEPFGEPNAFGFEMSLRASLAESVSPEWEVMSRISWRFTIACLPVLVFASCFFGFKNSGFFPEGLGGVVSQWSALISGDLL